MDDKPMCVVFIKGRGGSVWISPVQSGRTAIINLDGRRDGAMTDTEKADNTIAGAGDQLFQFAIDRGDMNAILDALPLEVPDKRVALEYEIQLLRIISVGWSIAFFGRQWPENVPWPLFLGQDQRLFHNPLRLRLPDHGIGHRLF